MLGVGGSIERASLSQPYRSTPVHNATAVPPPAPTVSSPDISESPETFSIISSEPSGASILLDGKDTGMITPSRVTIPATRPFRFQLRRLGYRDFVRSDMTAQQLGSHFTAKLKEVDYAYLDIDLIPPKNARLYINGSLTNDRQPFRNVAIPSDAPTRIRVEDNQGNWDETSIQLSRSQRKRIILNLRGRVN
jgi:hypothetical protein